MREPALARRRLSFVVLGVLALVGCEALFEIDEPTLSQDAGPDGGVDANVIDAQKPDAQAEAEAASPECSAAAECDDGVFCNGAENCSAGECQSGTPPAQEIVVCKAAQACPDEYFVRGLGADPKCGTACCCETTLYCEAACTESLVACCVDGVCKCPKGYYQTGTTTALCFCGVGEAAAITCERML